MKLKNMFWAALSMTAALVMTACSNDDNDMTEAPVAPSTSKTIPYTVTVGGDEATTRATVDSDNRTLYFAEGDQLYITGTNIQGVLDLQAGDEGKTTGATFSGDLEYTGGGTPADNLPLTATLVSAQQANGSEVTINSTTGAVTVNYPTSAYCATINDAVQQYSRLINTSTSTYGAKAFSLTQQTAFLNFVITFEDGTNSGTVLSAVVKNGETTLCTANVTTMTEDEKVVAKFVLPVAAGTTLSSATVTMGSKAALNINNATLEGKVYNVRKTQAAPAPTYTMAANATTDDIGKLICTDGHIHAYNTDAECTATRVAMIAYVGNGSDCTHGLAIQLIAKPSKMDWSNACSYTSYPSITGNLGTWRLPSKADWQNMFVGCAKSGDAGASDSMDPIAGFKEKIGATGITWKSLDCWSSTGGSESKAWIVRVSLGYSDAEAVFSEADTSDPYQVLGCLAF